MEDEASILKLCGCGRLRTKIHCPNCGCATVLAFSKRERVTRPGGIVEELRSYRCRRCSEIFNDDKWKNECHAPIPRTGHPRKPTISRLFELASLDRSATLAETASALNWLTEVRIQQEKEKKQ